jgi:hypothetical protein
MAKDTQIIQNLISHENQSVAKLHLPSAIAQAGASVQGSLTTHV